MINTLRITSVLVALGAMALLGMSVVYGIDKDSQVQDLITAQGPIALFEQNQGKAAAQTNVNAKHPLVSAAEQYALLMNPPEPPKPRVAPTRTLNNFQRPTSAQRNVSSSIRCVGICYNADDPKLSLALIDKPGKGQQWVRINDKVDHHVVQDIRNSEIVLMNGGQEQVVPVEKKPVLSLIKGENEGADVTAKRVNVSDSSRPSIPSRPTGRPVPSRSLPLRSTEPVPEDMVEQQVNNEALEQVMTHIRNTSEDPNMSESEREQLRIRNQMILEQLKMRARGRARLEPDTAAQLHSLGKDFVERHTQSLDSNDM